MKRGMLVVGRAGAIAATVGGTVWLVLVVWRSHHRSDLATFGAYAAAIVVIAAGLITRAWSAGALRGGRGSEPGSRLPVVSVPDIGVAGDVACDVSEGAGVSLAAPLGRRDLDRPLRGRSVLLDELVSALAKGTDVARVQILCGLGGCGKTSIALELVARVRQLAESTGETWWVSAAESRQFRAGMIALAFRVGVTEEQIRHGDVADLLWQRLAVRSDSWLLVIDNADDVGVLATGSRPVTDGNGWLRPLDVGRGLVVVTSRDGRKATWETVGQMRRVGVLDDEDAAQVLIDLAGLGTGSREDASALAHRLGGLPLALRLAGLYLHEAVTRPPAFSDQAMVRTFAGYQELLDQGQIDVAFRASGRTDGGGEQISAEDARDLIGRAWEISLEMLDRQGLPQARPLLGLLACFAAAPVPYELLLRPDTMASSVLFAGLTGPALWESLQTLEAFGFVDHLAAQGMDQSVSVLQLHPLVRDTSQPAADGDGQREAFVDLAGALSYAAAAAAGEPERPATWTTWEVLAPHPAHLLMKITIHPGVTEDVAHAAHLAARYFAARGRFEEAEQLYRQVLAVRRQMLGDAHPDTLSTRNEVAWTLGRQGRFEDAEVLYRQVLAGRERLLGDAHPDTLSTRNAVAWMLGERGRFEEAEVLYRQVLAGRERLLGDTDPDTLSTRNDVARVLGEQGRYSEAEQMYQQVLGASERVLGDAHPDTLSTRISVARVIGQQGRWPEAEQMYRQILQVSERTLGGTHPHTLTSRHGIGRTLEGQGHYKEAEEVYRKVLAVRKEAYGAEHPHTLITKCRLFHLIALQGRYSEAEIGLRATAMVQARVIGGSHPMTLVCRHSLAWAILKQDRCHEAESEAAAVLFLRTQVLGPQHPLTIETQELLAETHRCLERG